MDWQTFYGLLAVAGVGLALWSNNPVLTKLALLLEACWLVSALTDDAFNLHRAAMIIPAADGVLAILVAMIGRAARSKVALAIFGLFVLQGVVHVIAIMNHLEATREYIETSNAVFAAQVLIVGGFGCVQGLDHRAMRRRRRPPPLVLSR